MAKLIQLGDNTVVREIALDKEMVTIGRTSQNDVQIESKSASSKHARIVIIGGDCFLEDLGSTNGTSVNGNPIKKHFLQNLDLIEMGNQKFKFVVDANDGAQPVDSNMEKTILLRVPKTGTLPLSAEVQPPPPPEGFFAKLKSWFKSG